MNWYKRIKLANSEFDVDEKSYEKAEKYFSIGHGDFNEDLGYEPSYIVWTLIDGDIEISREYEGGDEVKSFATHGTEWGHNITDKTFKGRYEPQTGRISIVRPRGIHQFRPIPKFLMKALMDKFRITGQPEVF